MAESKVHPDDPKDDGRRVPAATYAWMIPVVTRIARRHGYAIGVHGSMGRDLDLIAVPWVEDANDPSELLEELCRFLDGSLKRNDGTLVKGKIDALSDFAALKPHGRMAYNILFTGSWHFIDISIIPPQKWVPQPVPPPPQIEVSQPPPPSQ